MPQGRPLVAGNWKMNGLGASVAEFDAICKGAAGISRADLLVCPPTTLLRSLADRIAGSSVLLGGQDCHPQASGAHTGDVSAEMLRDAGARYAIVGHSERRADHAESNAIVHAKAEACWRAGLIAIVCVGETQQQRDASEALAVVGTQINGSVPTGATAANTVVAYEPVWAIGTGRTATAGDVAEMHAFIRDRLANRFRDAAQMRLLYGGSVKPGNAGELMAVANVNGALVGGASLKAADFLAIAAACG